MKHMKKFIYALIVPLLVVSGLVFANREAKPEAKPAPKTLSKAEMKARIAEDKKKWEASPDGIRFNNWKNSPAGKKVRASHDKIIKHLKDSSNMEAVVTSVTFQRAGATSGPKWLLVSIGGEDYMMQYNLKEFQQLKSLKVNDKIIVRSRSAGYSPNHPYLIVSGDYIEHNNKVLFKRDFSKNKGC